MCIRKGEAEHKRVQVGFVYITWPPEDRKVDMKWRLDQDQ